MKTVYPMDAAIRDVRKGRLNQSQAALKYDVRRETLCRLCRALGIKVKQGRPRKGKK